jgi:arylsulfatase A-like enzyme
MRGIQSVPPTRAICLTGRHDDRFGIFFSNQGHLPAQEITLASMLKSKGYTTGHFGKWHMGRMSMTITPKGKRRNPKANFAPPWLRDYDPPFGRAVDCGEVTQDRSGGEGGTRV